MHNYIAIVLVLLLVFTTARTDYMASIQGVSQQEVTKLVVPLAVGTPALSPQLHGPLSALGYSSMGLQTHEMSEVKYGLE